MERISVLFLVLVKELGWAASKEKVQYIWVEK